MADRYEIINYEGLNYKLNVGTVGYVAPHIHRELELGLVLSGRLRLVTPSGSWVVDRGDLWINNPCESHECFGISANKTYTDVTLQLSPAFFRAYYPAIDRIAFTETLIDRALVGDSALRELADRLLTITELYAKKQPRYELQCAGLINLLFDRLIEAVPNRLMADQEMEAIGLRGSRIHRMTAYIEEHCSEKLLLQDLADQEGLTLTYLSHFFSDSFGMSFQEYLMRLRCRQAREMMLTTELSITDISLACGFSAPRYLNAGFTRVYGETPAAFRKRTVDFRFITAEDTSAITDDHVHIGNYSASEALKQIEAFRRLEASTAVS